MVDDNKKKKDKKPKKRPEQYKINNYDFSRIDNLEKCEEKTYICPKCLERDGKQRLGHYHEFIKLPREIRANPDIPGGFEILFRKVMVHGHFTLHKGTKAPALNSGRNCVCDLGTRWANKLLETYETIHITNKKPVPEFAKQGE